MTELKSIWHKADEAPRYCFLCVFYDKTRGLSVGHYNPVKKQFCSGDRRFNHDEIKSYCDIHEILDPLWQGDKPSGTRKKIYKRLSDALGYEYHTCNTRTIEECRTVYRLVKAMYNN